MIFFSFYRLLPWLNDEYLYTSFQLHEGLMPILSMTYSQCSFCVSEFKHMPLLSSLLNIDQSLWSIWCCFVQNDRHGLCFHSSTCSYQVQPAHFLSFLFCVFPAYLLTIRCLWVCGLLSGSSIQSCLSVCLFC